MAGRSSTGRAARRCRTRCSTRSPATCGSRTRTSAGRSRPVVRSDALVAEARLAGAGLPRVRARRGRVRAEHDDAQLRALPHGRPGSCGPATRSSPRSSTTTRNVAPWLELAQDLELNVRLVELHDDTTLDLDDLEAKLSERTRVVAFPLASNAVGTLVDVASGLRAGSRGGRARVGGRRALRAACTDRRRRARRRRLDLLAVQVLRAAPRNGLRPSRSCSSVGGPTRCARQATRPSAAASRRARSRTSCSRASSPRSTTSATSAGTRSARTSGRSASAPRRAARRAARLHGLPTMEGRVPTFAVTHAGCTPDAVAARLGRAEDRRVGRQLLRRRGDGPARARRTEPCASGSPTTTLRARSTGCSRR